MSLKMIHISGGAAHPGLWTELFCRELRALGSLEIVENGQDLSEQDRLEKMRQADVILGGWGSVVIPPDLAVHPGRVRYICSLTGSVKYFVSKAHVEAGLLVTNWGDAIALNVAEGAMCLLLATLKDLHAQILAVRNGKFALDAAHYGGSLEDLNVGVYGYGAIGRKFVELLVPFGCTIRCFDPFVKEFPPYVIPVESLETLFRESEAIAIHAGLNDGTKGTVTRELLALLPRHGVLINTARGDIVDQDALFDEVRSGRLRAGLDVLRHPEYLEPENPIRQTENLIWTCHKIGRAWPLDGLPPKKLNAMQKVCLDNLRRFQAGQPLRFVMDAKRYDLST
jgi:phosphoglycerate dehydrogenase-like enzyme